MTGLARFEHAARCVFDLMKDPRLAGVVYLAPHFCVHGRVQRATATWPDASTKTFAVRQLDDGAWQLGAPVALITEN